MALGATTFYPCISFHTHEVLKAIEFWWICVFSRAREWICVFSRSRAGNRRVGLLSRHYFAIWVCTGMPLFLRRQDGTEVLVHGPRMCARFLSRATCRLCFRFLLQLGVTPSGRALRSAKGILYMSHQAFRAAFVLC